MAAYNLGGLTAALWGTLADRYRLHRWLGVGGGMITAVGLAVFPLTTRLVAWLALALLQGLGAVGVATMANLFVVEAHPQDEWEERIGWLQTFYGAGQVGGLFIAGALSQWSLHIGLFAAAVLTGLAALTGWVTTRTPPGPLIPKPTLLYPPRPSEWPISSPQHLFHHLTLTPPAKGMAGHSLTVRPLTGWLGGRALRL